MAEVAVDMRSMKPKLFTNRKDSTRRNPRKCARDDAVLTTMIQELYS